MKTYELGDRLTKEDCALIGVPLSTQHSLRSIIGGDRNLTVRAVATDDYRVPYAGDWFLSGALPRAYQAARKLGSPYRIARLVKVRRILTEVIET